MMAAISATWKMNILRCCESSGSFILSLLLLGKLDPGLSHFK
jgi:hypothetical protein